MKVVVFTCDRYADVVPAFHWLWHDRWPDCPHELVYVTNSQRLETPAKTYYVKGEEHAFGWRLRRFVDWHYADEHMLLMMADYLPKGINSGLIAEAHQLCALDDIRHVRLRPMPHPQFPYPAPGFGRIDKTQRYSLSLQPGIWETRVLYDLLDDRWNPWQCEINGSERAYRMPGEFLSTEELAISHINYYAKGKAQGVKWVRENVPEDKWPEAVRNG